MGRSRDIFSFLLFFHLQNQDTFMVVKSGFCSRCLVSAVGSVSVSQKWIVLKRKKKSLNTLESLFPMDKHCDHLVFFSEILLCMYNHAFLRLAMT